MNISITTEEYQELNNFVIEFSDAFKNDYKLTNDVLYFESRKSRSIRDYIINPLNFEKFEEEFRTDVSNKLDKFHNYRIFKAINEHKSKKEVSIQDFRIHY